LHQNSVSTTAAAAKATLCLTMTVVSNSKAFQPDGVRTRVGIQDAHKRRAAQQHDDAYSRQCKLQQLLVPRLVVTMVSQAADKKPKQEALGVDHFNKPSWCYLLHTLSTCQQAST
jgi:hypothetical protein